MIDRAGAELDREGNGTRLGELVAVQAKLQTGLAAGPEIAPRFVDVERAALEKDVGGFGDSSGLGEHLREEEVDIGRRAGVGELRRDGMGAEPGGYSSGCANRAQLGQLGVAIEAVSRFSLERRRPGTEHPGDVTLERRCEPSVTGLTCRANGRQDAAARRVQLLVTRS